MQLSAIFFHRIPFRGRSYHIYVSKYSIFFKKLCNYLLTSKIFANFVLDFMATAMVCVKMGNDIAVAWEKHNLIIRRTKL